MPRVPVAAHVSGRRVAYPTDRMVPALVDATARDVPGAVAVEWHDGALTYGALDALVGALAADLRAAGAGPGGIVPLLVDDGPHLVVAMLATWRAGAAFVPLDPGWPDGRRAAALARIGSPVVVVPGAVTLAAGTARAVPVHVDPVGRAPAAPPPPVTAGTLAYGFFTSGSTGEPKCALNRHGGLLNRFQVMSRRFAADGAVVMQNSPHVFDSSLWQLLWPLTRGARVAIPDRRGVDLPATVAFVERHGVTMTDFVPSIFNTLVQLLLADPALAARLASLRRLLVGGEEINPKAVATFRALLPHVAVTNTYGPTEASIGCVFHDVTDDDAASVPIGEAIDNTYAVVVGPDGRPAADGEVGEILIGGTCLGAGYLGREDLTAAAFVPNTVAGIPGDLLYRTGDLGYRRPDGKLVFAGRRDHQVKIAGVRIEPAEIEATLLAHPAVAEAKAVAYGPDGARGLACFVTLASAVTPAELDAHARHSLPASAVPRVVVLDALPLTPNGKADRRRLAALALDGEPAGEALTGLAGDVAAAWEAVLGLRPRHPWTRFAECGGTSLTAHLLLLELNRRFGVTLALSDVIDAPTVRDQTELITRPPAQRRPRADTALRDATSLDPAIRRDGAARALRAPDRVLLTGATGFIGAHLLAELLRETAATVYCLTRAGDAAHAARRVRGAVERLVPGEWDPARVVAIHGDLGRPRLGMDAATFDRLGDTVDAIVHAGALVNLLLDYETHRPANVHGTVEVLRLAACGRVKHLVHLSTLSVQAPGGQPPADGYSRSKWVAERLLATARERGVPSTVVRLGEVMPHATTGDGNARSTLHGLLVTSTRLGMRFSSGATTDWTPVDRVSAVIVRLLGRNSSEGVVDLVGPGEVALDDVLEALAAHQPLRTVPYPAFWAAASARARGDDDIARLLTLLPDPAESGYARALATLFGTPPPPDVARRAASLAAELDVVWRPVGTAELRTCVTPHLRQADRVVSE